jgi:hypothetical protein
MRGGAQAHLMRCNDGNYYVVKFQNNPQHRRILVNELLGTRLAAHLGLPTAPAAVVEVRGELIDNTAELVMLIGTARHPCLPGFQFGSRYPGDPARLAVHDFLPDERLGAVENLHDFAGILAFDKWVCNTNGRQAIFFLDAGEARYKAWMIDQGFCFNAGAWDFPDSPLRGIYTRSRVYDDVRGMEAFAPWIERIERLSRPEELDRLASELPPEWFDGDTGALYELLERLRRRPPRLPDLILEAQKSYRQPFRNWT